MSAPGAPHGTRQQEEAGGQPLVYGTITDAVSSTTHILHREDYQLKSFDGTTVFAAAGYAPAAGSGSPEGVVTRNPGTPYIDTATEDIWFKKTGTGNTGWVQITMA